MALTIRTKGEDPKPEKDERPRRSYVRAKPPEEFSAEKFSLYGRLAMTVKEVAMMEKLSEYHVRNLLKDSRLRTAFEAGRAECIVALRQKVLQLGLSGDTRVLLHAAKHLGGLRDDREEERLEEIDAEAHSWESSTRARIEALRRKYAPSDPDEQEAVGE